MSSVTATDPHHRSPTEPTEAEGHTDNEIVIDADRGSGLADDQRPGDLARAVHRVRTVEILSQRSDNYVPVPVDDASGPEREGLELGV